MCDRANGLTNLDDVRGLKCMIDVIRNLLAARLGADRAFKIRRETRASLGRNCDSDLPRQADVVSAAGDVR